MLKLGLIFSIIGLIHAQTVSPGIIGGVSPGDDYRSRLPHDVIQQTNHTAGYAIGLSLEIRLSHAFSLEVDGIYRQQHFTDGPGSVVTWEVPVPAKYRFAPLGSFRPFIEGGPSFRATGNLNANPSHFGSTAGAGLTFHTHGIRIEPTVRYTHWAGNHDVDEREVPNRVEFLVNVSTGADTHSSLFGHRLSVGGIGGMTLTKDYRSMPYQIQVIGGPLVNLVSGAGPQSFIGGSMIEWAMARGFAGEADAIYRPVRSSGYIFGPPPGAPNSGNLASVSESKSVTWEFPVLAKYRFTAHHHVSPILEAGPSFRPPIQVSGRISPFGLTGGLGLESRLYKLKIAPVARLTHWGGDSIHGAGGLFRNEAVALVGFSF